MTLDADPYRTLGLSRGASLDEVKRAYRRLAKVNHPDAAGEAALPRFLAIQAAYEQLLNGSGASGRGRRTPPTSRRASEADPDRSDATRRAYGGRARSAPPGAGGTPPGARGRPPGTTGEGAGATGEGAGRGANAGQGARGATGPGRSSWSSRGGSRDASGRTGRRRSSEPRDSAGDPSGDAARGTADGPPNKATLGSTSYDGADAGPFEPGWGGASWYGTTSGTYWTLNPKEYADPRKHGPEYQARARRSTRARAAETGTTAGTGPPPDPASDPVIDPATDPVVSPAAGPTHTTASWWDSTAGHSDDPVADTPPRERHSPPDVRGAAPAVDPAPTDPGPPDLGRAAADVGRALTDVQFGGWRGRVVRAVVGWLPIALGLGWLVGELSGCGRFAATCDGAADPILLGLQLALLGVMLLVPSLASLATVAALMVLAASLVAALILSATGAAADGDSRRVALGLVLLVAWLVGLGIAIVRRARALPSPTSPVS